MKKRLFFALGLSVFLASFLFSPTTSAVSIYDDVLKLTPPDELGTQLNTGYPNLAFTVDDIFDRLENGTCYSGSNEVRTRALSALDNANDYIIVQEYSASTPRYKSAVTLYVSLVDTDFSTDWNTNFLYAIPDNSSYVNQYTAYFTFSAGNSYAYYYQCNGYLDSNNIFAMSAKSGTSTLVQYDGFSISYPSDYEGETLDPDTKLHYLNYIPSFIVHDNFTSVEPWRVQISDQNFFTTNQVSFLCSDDLAPIIRYQIKDEFDNVLVDDAISATAPIVYDFPIFSSVRSYTISGAYDCGSGVFVNSGSLSFNINAQGSLVNSSNFTACVSEEFPWVHMNSCLENFYTVINMLTFKQITLGNVWEFQTTGCRNLVVLNGWLGVQSQVCPMFPAYIRNVVTPFVTFLLGLLSLQLINRIRREGT